VRGHGGTAAAALVGAAEAEGAAAAVVVAAGAMSAWTSWHNGCVVTEGWQRFSLTF